MIIDIPIKVTCNGTGSITPPKEESECIDTEDVNANIRSKYSVR